jgi:hypothetical protein
MAAFASVIDSVVTRALATTDPTAIILEEAQREIDRRGIQFA